MSSPARGEGDEAPFAGVTTTRARLRAEARRAWARLRGGELSPMRAGLSVAVGLAVGLTPLYGLHLFVVLLVCLPLRLDAPLAYLAANISLPFVSPFIVLGEIEVGAWFRGGHAVTLDVDAVRAHGAGPFLVDLVVGTAIVAPLAALFGGAVTYRIARAAKKRRANATPADALFARAVEAVAQRYAPGRRAAYHYVRGKLASDPVARALVERAAKASLGEVTDIGCGRGQMALLLLEANSATRVLGFDWDAKKIDDARRAAKEGAPLAAEFTVTHAETGELPACDTALLLDVLHYMDVAAQDALLDRVAKAARRTVLVRELDPDRGLRSAFTRAEEWLATRGGVNRGGLHPRPIAEITRRLEAHGFVTRVEPCWAGTPFSNVLVVAERETPTR